MGVVGFVGVGGVVEETDTAVADGVEAPQLLSAAHRTSTSAPPATPAPGRRSTRVVDLVPSKRRYPNPAVAGALEAGPWAGAGFSERPDNGGTNAPDGYGQTVLAGTQIVTLVGKSNPVATATGALGWPIVSVTFMTRPP